jgi:4-amino-4-deoxy-L-arabinose transferase-like glycosyltransferase
LAGEALAKRGHPGPLFYPINYLWRTSPVVLLGLLAFLAALATRRAVWRLPAERKSAVSLLLFAAVFLVVMTIGSKQIDRYLLPMFLPLDLVAGVGWILALRWLGSKLPAASRFLAPAVVGALLVSQGALAFTTAPYYLPYFNPLLGGPKRAVEMVLVGWGEGLDQAARYLNGKPGSKDLTVMSWYGDGPFSYFFDGKALQYDDSVIAKVMAPEAAEANGSNLDTPDYVVLYVNQWQRDLAPAALLARRPEHVVRLAGVEYARIYSVQSEDSGNSPGN